MCLVLTGYKVSKKYPLILAANRDEFYERPTARMDFWETHPDLLAGKDLKQGGTWFGVHRHSGFAALTNYRNPSLTKSHAPSRGEIIINLLQSGSSWSGNSCSGSSGENYLRTLQQKAGMYNGFNLIFGSHERLFWFSSLQNRIEELSPGIHGLSNAFLNTPWPKVVSGKKALADVISSRLSPESLLSILRDATLPDDHLLPDTGVGIEWERRLSSVFIQSDIYGTRSSTIMLIDPAGTAHITERTYLPENRLKYSDHSFRIQLMPDKKK